MKTIVPAPEALTIGELLKPERQNRYLIPRYQRNYAWGQAEIFQLIRDVEDYRQLSAVSPYYLGTLVVHRPLDSGSWEYETIDGQQRLTTLSILMAYLRYEKVVGIEDFTEPVIRFQSRAKSDKVLKELFSSTDPAVHCDPSSSLTLGFGLVAKALKEAHGEARDDSVWGEWLEKFSRYLCDQVVIFRVQVPPDTDLNHYFEVMNSRGEQLEKHEVLKAELMSVLEPGDDSNTFARIWDACSNTEKYIQMCFGTSIRAELFGQGWDNFLPGGFAAISEAFQSKGKSSEGNQTREQKGSKTLANILSDPPVLTTGSKDKEAPPDQFHPVINFPNFLLHVLCVHTKSDSIPLDDKNLLKAFKGQSAGMNATEVKAFAFDLLRARFLFDQCIIKKDYRNGSDKLSLLRMKMSSDTSAYVNTFGDDAADDEGAVNNKRLLMLQAALQVSNPSMSYKYWVLGALRFLMKQPMTGKIKAVEFLEHLESMARGFVFDVYLCTEGSIRLGDVTSPETPWRLHAKRLDPKSQNFRYQGIRNNLVFNFLDYLLWVGNPEKVFRESKCKAEGFNFTTRSSVEHHSPQHPESGTNELGDEVHRFGNLYLISQSKNSRLSNFRAETKKREFLSSRTADSLKQQFMLDQEGDWDAKAIDDHEKEMLVVLNSALSEHPPFDPRRFAVSENKAATI